MQDALLSILSTLNEYMFDYILTFLLVTAGLWYSIKTRFVQARCFMEGVRNVHKNMSFNGVKQEVGITPFRALVNAIGAQVGMGNIVGSAGAILAGGPGAIFWMWITGFFGMATMYAETVCALKTRRIESDGTIRGGPVYYILEAFKGHLGKILAAIFAVSMVLSDGLLNLVMQANSIAANLNDTFGIPNWATGVLLAVICGFILKGGLERISAVNEKMVPIMSYMFIGGAVAVLIARIHYLPEAFYMIFYYAFDPQAILGGGLGEALRISINQGVQRGAFSNEAGMGTIPYAHVQANVDNPHAQGVMAMHGVFFDTFIVLTLNALVIISTLYTSDGILFNGYRGDVTTIINSGNLSQIAFGSVLDVASFDGLGARFVSVCLFLFAFSTILVTYMFGRVNVVYLFGEKATQPYFILIVFLMFIGTFTESELLWAINDLFNGFLVGPNVLALFALTHLLKDSRAGLKK